MKTSGRNNWIAAAANMSVEAIELRRAGLLSEQAYQRGTGSV